MSIFRRMLLKLSRRRRLEAELEAELAFHHDQAREHNNEIGLGNVARITEEARDIWRFTLIEDFCRDLSYAVRSLFRTPAFAVTAIVTLALGIGANTAVFTLIYRTMLASLPVREPGKLFEVHWDRGNSEFPGTAFSYSALQILRTEALCCSSILGFSNVSFHTRIEGSPVERLSGQLITGDYFSALGVPSISGRPILPDDDRQGGKAVVVISHSLWRERFNEDSTAIGKTLVLENTPFTIVGVAPADFSGLERGRHIDFWIPLETERSIRTPSYTSSAGYKWLQIVARVKPSVPSTQAEAELRVLYSKRIIEDEIAQMLVDPGFDAVANAEMPKQMRRRSVVLSPAASGLSGTREQFSGPLLVLMTIVGFLLLIACTNVGNLLFARAPAREKEIALKLSLGAGRFRLIRQLLTESAVLVAAGGTLAVFVAYLLTKRLTSFLAGSSLPLVVDISPDFVTLGFTTGIAILTVFLFGLLPSFRSTNIDFATRLKGSAPDQSHTGKSIGWSGGLVIGEVALLLVLMFGAGLFLRTLHNLNSIDLGFNRDNVLLLSVDPFGSGLPKQRLTVVSSELMEKIEALPGVRSASLTMFQPITGGSGVNLSFIVRRESDSEAQPIIAADVWVNAVGPGYFRTLGIPVIVGREFDPHDSDGPTHMVIVNQAFAQRYFGEGSPIGKIITQRNIPMEIVGVVGNSKYAVIRQGNVPTVYRNILQNPEEQATFPQMAIRTDRDPDSIAAAVRNEVRRRVGNVLVRETTLAAHIDASIVRERLVTALSAAFGGLALLLAVIGLYGVVTNSVTRRTREIGIRMALGFDRRRAVSMVLREVFVLVGGGIILGLPLAVVVSRLIASQLYGLTPDDPSTIFASVGALLFSAVTAAFFPARRASRVDPMVAMRAE